MNRFVLLIVIALTIVGCSKPINYNIVIKNVTLFDGENEMGIVNIAINADTISAISNKELHADSIIIGNGKFVVPGLVNGHGHLWLEDHIKESYKAGVLANMGMHSGNQKRDDSLKQLSQKSGRAFYYSSKIAATVPGGHPTHITPNMETINDSISTTKWVDNRISEGADYIKIIKEGEPWFGSEQLSPTLSNDSIKKIIDYAKLNGKKVFVHIGTLQEMLDIAPMKPEGFVHMWYWSKNAELRDEHLEVIKASNAFIIPTALINKRGFERMKKESGDFAEWGMNAFLSMEIMMKDIKRLHDNGILLVAGTDSGNPGVMWGNDLIEEIKIYSEAGLSNIDALKTATGNAAKAFDIQVGKLKVGNKANLVLLSANPIEDLNNLKKVEQVWKNGKTE
jgi:imidazolonepropionase-like amidohydrolase